MIIEKIEKGEMFMKMFKVVSVLFLMLFLCSNAWGTMLMGNTTYTFDSKSFNVVDRSGGTYINNSLFTGEYIGTIELNNDSMDLLEYLIGIYLDDSSYDIVSYDKVDIPKGTSSAGSLTNDTDNDGNFLTVSWDKDVKSGTWTTAPLYTSFYSVKGSDEFASHLDAVTTSAPVPEPTTMLLSGLGLIGMAAYLRRKKNRKEII